MNSVRFRFRIIISIARSSEIFLAKIFQTESFSLALRSLFWRTISIRTISISTILFTKESLENLGDDKHFRRSDLAFRLFWISDFRTSDRNRIHFRRVYPVEEGSPQWTSQRSRYSELCITFLDANNILLLNDFGIQWDTRRHLTWIWAKTQWSVALHSTDWRYIVNTFTKIA